MLQESQEESDVDNEDIDHNEERSDNTNTATFAEKDIITPSTSGKGKFQPAKQNSSVPKKQKTEDALSGAYSVLKEIHQSRQARDEYTLFGEQVAAQLRKLPTEHSKIIVQQIISTTLFEARLGKYNAPTSSFSPTPSIPNLNISTAQWSQNHFPSYGQSVPFQSSHISAQPINTSCFSGQTSCSSYSLSSASPQYVATPLSSSSTTENDLTNDSLLLDL